MLAIVKKTKRELSVFLLASILFQFINPIVGLALTSGPIQPEYTSYESPDAKDIVSLVTGDFQYSLPVMEVPGSEGGFEIPLFYHSGIRNEEEASWVGLGWNINVGCIDRSVVGFPDDYRMGPQDPIRGTEPVHSEVYAPGGNGWSDNYLWYQEGWDSEKGYSGSINILNIYSSSWGEGKKQIMVF